MANGTKKNQIDETASEDEGKTPKPTNTPEHLKADVTQISKGSGEIVIAAGRAFVGVCNIALGAAKTASHSYQSIFNANGRKTLAAMSLIAVISYGAAQKELGAPSLGDIYDKAKSTVTNSIETGSNPDENGGYPKEHNDKMTALIEEHNTPPEQ